MEVNNLEHTLTVIQILKHGFDMLFELCSVLILVTKDEDYQSRLGIVQFFEELLASQKLQRFLVLVYFLHKVTFTELLESEV
jgi:hypothetical protein